MNTAARSMLKTRDYLRLAACGDLFAIPLAQVEEIVNYERVTAMPAAAPWIRGVFNLRGRVIPVADLGLRLGLAQANVGRRTVLVIVKVPSEHEPIDLAIVADSVRDVVAIDPDHVEQAPPFGLQLNVAYISGLIRYEDRFLKLLNLAALVGITPLSEPWPVRNEELVPARAKPDDAKVAPKVEASPPISEPPANPPPSPEPEPEAQATEIMPGIFLFDDLDAAQ